MFAAGVVQDLQGMCISVMRKNWEVFEPLTTHLPLHLQHSIKKYMAAPDEVIYPTAQSFM